MEGYVYVLTNKTMPGLVKIGFTLRSVDERIVELSAVTGVPSPFQLEFACRVSHAADLERHAHARLKRRSAGKEFFRCSVADAVRNVKTAALEHEIETYVTDGRAASVFLTEQEEKVAIAVHQQGAQVAEQRRRVEAAEAAALVDLQRKKDELVRRLDREVPNCARLLDKYTPKTHKGVAGFLYDVTIGLAITPPVVDWGNVAARKLQMAERDSFKRLHATVSFLYALNDWQVSDDVLKQYTQGLFESSHYLRLHRIPSSTLLGLWQELCLAPIRYPEDASVKQVRAFLKDL